MLPELKGWGRRKLLLMGWEAEDLNAEVEEVLPGNRHGGLLKSGARVARAADWGGRDRVVRTGGDRPSKR